VQIVWCSYELRPEPVPTLDPKGAYLTRAWRDSVYPLAAKLGITMRLPPVQPRTRLAHEAAHWARSRGRFEEYNAALFRAFFERGEDIGREDVLARLAKTSGLDGTGLRAALAEHRFEESVLADVREAGTFLLRAVPAFAAGEKAVECGVQSLQQLRNLVARARSD
jgi:predicted DsbA family dithiol-disulfide isomerase